MRLTFQPVDLRLEIGHDEIRLSFEDAATVSQRTKDVWPGLRQLAALGLVDRWRTTQRYKPDLIAMRRIAIVVRDRRDAQQPWESMVAEAFAPLDVSTIIVRSSPVLPRSAAIPYTLPLRVLDVNAPAEGGARPSIDAVFHGSLARHGETVQAAAVEWPSWGVAALPEGMRAANVLHIDRLPPLPANPFSGDTCDPGTVGWLVAKLTEWQVHLLVLRSDGPLDTLRAFAAALQARGGPAVVVGSDALMNREFFKRFYELLIHDNPIDVCWINAAGGQSLWRGGSVFVGAGREESLRPSAVALRLYEFLAPTNAVSRQRLFRKAFTLSLPRGGRFKAARAIDERLAPIRADWTMSRFDYREREGMIPLGEALRLARQTIPTRPTVEDYLSTPRAFYRRTSERFVNHSFWTAGAHGSLAPVSQRAGTFTRGAEYQLAVQIGPRSKETLTIGETALVEEVIRSVDGGAWIEIGVTAIDVDLVGDPVRRVWLPERREVATDAVYFPIRLLKDGVNRLRVTVYAEQRVLQSFRIGVYAGPAGQRSKALAASLGLRAGPESDRAFLPVLEYNLMPVDGAAAGSPRPRALGIVANEWSGDAVITVKSAGAFDVVVSSRLPGIVAQVHDALRHISNFDQQNAAYPFNADNGLDAAKCVEAFRDLAGPGRALFTELFGTADWDAMDAALATVDSTIHVAPVLRDKVIPWSCVYGRELPADVDSRGRYSSTPVCLAALPAADGSLAATACGGSPACTLSTNPTLQPHDIICPLHFWGFRYRIELPAKQMPPSAGSSASATAVSEQIQVKGAVTLVPAVNGSFGAEGPHFTKLSKLTTDPIKYQLAPFEKQYTASGFLTKLRTPPLHVVYFFCHTAGTAATSRVLLQAPDTKTEDPIPATSIAALARGKQKWDPPALVFMNACQTMNYSADVLSPFLTFFVDRLGASGLIGTDIDVWDLVAAETAQHFFSRFLDGDSAAVALMTARRRMLAKGNPLGLVYTLYASADLVLTSAP